MSEQIDDNGNFYEIIGLILFLIVGMFVVRIAWNMYTGAPLEILNGVKDLIYILGIAIVVVFAIIVAVFKLMDL